MIKSFFNIIILSFFSNIFVLNCSNPVNQIINPHITFEKTFGGPLSDHGYSVIQSTDGSFLITGLYVDTSDSRQENIFLIKTDINGNLVWEKTYGGSLKNDYGYSVIESSNGGYIIAGATRSYGSGDADVYLIKTDISGNLIWDKAYGGSTSENGVSMIETTDGDYVVAGSKYLLNTRDYDFYVIKTDYNGNLLWGKNYGGILNDNGRSVIETTDGGYMIAGSTSSFGAGEIDVYIIKVDYNGNLIWEKTFGGLSNDIAYSIIKTTDDNYVIAGYTNSSGAGSTDIYLLKIENSGKLVWENTFGGSFSDKGFSVIQSTDEGFIITGSTQSSGTGDEDIYLIKTDNGGNLVWEKSFGGSLKDRGLSVIETTQGSYVVAGETRSFGSGSEDIYLIKIDL